MEQFYGEDYKILQDVLQSVQDDLSKLSACEHLCGRIKTPQSVVAKLAKRGLSQTKESAFDNLFDIAGVRVVVRFIDDVYAVLNHLDKDYEVLEKKDYIKNPKLNGYRSLHLIICAKGENRKMPVEIQIRTISQDSWASLEHKMKYKKEIPHAKLITSELLRCADEMASIDISMQTISDMISGGLS